ncbi:MAG: hypothetical protein ACKPKO_00690, partial [Candidatus Fonsibacter sp.]
MLKDTPSDQLLATKDGTLIRVLEPDDLKKGAVIELTNATYLEAGPAEPSPTDPRVFIVTRNGEHYLETVSSEDDLSITMKMAEHDVSGAVSRSLSSVLDTIAAVVQTILQLDAAKAAATLDAAISQAALPPAAATSSSDPH